MLIIWKHEKKKRNMEVDHAPDSYTSHDGKLENAVPVLSSD